MARISPAVDANGKQKKSNKKLGCKKSHGWEQKSNETGVRGSDTHAHGQMCLGTSLWDEASEIGRVAGELRQSASFLFIVLITGPNSSQVLEGWSCDRIMVSGFENNVSVSRRPPRWHQEPISLSHCPAPLTLSFNCPPRPISEAGVSENFGALGFGTDIPIHLTV